MNHTQLGSVEKCVADCKNLASGSHDTSKTVHGMYRNYLAKVEFLSSSHSRDLLQPGLLVHFCVSYYRSIPTSQAKRHGDLLVGIWSKHSAPTVGESRYLHKVSYEHVAQNRPRSTSTCHDCQAVHISDFCLAVQLYTM